MAEGLVWAGAFVVGVVIVEAAALMTTTALGSWV
jgi:hypothetical protein